MVLVFICIYIYSLPLVSDHTLLLKAVYFKALYPFIIYLLISNYLNTNGFFDAYQLGFHQHHCMEHALMLNDNRLNKYASNRIGLALLDLGAVLTL